MLPCQVPWSLSLWGPRCWSQRRFDSCLDSYYVRTMTRHGVRHHTYIVAEGHRRARNGNHAMFRLVSFGVSCEAGQQERGTGHAGCERDAPYAPVTGMQERTQARLRDLQTLAALPPDVQQLAAQRLQLAPTMLQPHVLANQVQQLQQVHSTYQLQVRQQATEIQRLQQQIQAHQALYQHHRQQQQNHHHLHQQQHHGFADSQHQLQHLQQQQQQQQQQQLAHQQQIQAHQRHQAAVYSAAAQRQAHPGAL
jgi:hypothetical protein